ncbi:MAG TPA: hypothetical protein DCQ58_08590 [Saprospirales bacterium]|nr:hypothetical protein [Saprospirales bacterium]
MVEKTWIRLNKACFVSKMIRHLNKDCCIKVVNSAKPIYTFHIWNFIAAGETNILSIEFKAL